MFCHLSPFLRLGVRYPFTIVALLFVAFLFSLFFAMAPKSGDLLASEEFSGFAAEAKAKAPTAAVAAEPTPEAGPAAKAKAAPPTAPAEEVPATGQGDKGEEASGTATPPGDPFLDHFFNSTSVGEKGMEAFASAY